MNETNKTVTLSSAEYRALIERIEDAEDNAFLDAVEVRERELGTEKARADHLPAELLDGEHPLRI